MATEYNITQVKFSYRQDVISKLDDIESKPTGGGTRKTTLVGHVAFTYRGFNNSQEYGTVLVDLQTLSTVDYDANGRYSNLVTTPLAHTTWESLKPTVTEAVEKEIESIKSQAAEVAYYKRALGTMQLIEVPEEGNPSGQEYGQMLRESILEL